MNPAPHPNTNQNNNTTKKVAKSVEFPKNDDEIEIMYKIVTQNKARPSRFSGQRARRKNIWVGRSEK